MLDDTLIYFIIGDNGASAEGIAAGHASTRWSPLNGLARWRRRVPDAQLDEFGGPKAYNHYAVGWAHAMDTPYQWTKQVASHWGGTRNGTIVHWPKGITGQGRTAHASSTTSSTSRRRSSKRPGLPEPTIVNGVQQSPIEGVSMVYSFDDAKAAERHETQYFEMFGNRGIYHKGWTAVTRHRTPWETGRREAAGLRRRRLGALRHQQGLDAGA